MRTGLHYTQAAMFVLATLWTVQYGHAGAQPGVGSGTSRAIHAQHRSRDLPCVEYRDIRTLMILAHGPLTLGMPYMSLMPIFAKDVLHGGARLQGFLLTIIGIGPVLGALGVASRQRRYSYGYSVVSRALAFGITSLRFCLSA